MTRKTIPLLAAAGLLMLTGACASVPDKSDPQAYAEYKRNNDPLEPMNRAIFNTNMALDTAIIRPVTKTYIKVVPKAGRQGVTNFIDNLMHPFIAANDLLQGKPGKAGEAIGRFVINSTLGLGGLFDPAADLGIEKHDEDFGQTLAVWGVPSGPYVMLPILGPSNIRDSAGIVAEVFLDPVGIGIDQANVANVAGTDISALTIARRGVDALDFRATNDELFDELHESADGYAVARSAYRQLREFQISDGAVVQSEAEEDIFDELYEEDDYSQPDGAEAPEGSETESGADPVTADETSSPDKDKKEEEEEEDDGDQPPF